MCCGIGRLGVLGGILALVLLILAVFSNAWLYTRDHVQHTPVTFRIGLWTVCPVVKRTTNNASNTIVVSPSCTNVRYTSWDDVTYAELGVSVSHTSHERGLQPAYMSYTPAFVSRMRWATPLCVSAVVLVSLATLLVVLGHCCQDHKTLVACGLYIIGGLTLGGGLVVFASVLSDVYIERPRIRIHGDVTGFEYRYGWSYLLAGAAFVMIVVAAVINVTAYLRRFPTVDDMVRAMVPGAERRLREHQGFAGEYLVQHRHKYQRHKTDNASLPSGLNARCFNKSEVIGGCDDIEGDEGVGGPLLNKPAPDICTTGAAVGKNSNCGGSNAGYLLDDASDDLAGTTVPIVLMHHRTNNADRFSTLQHKTRSAPLAPLAPLPPHAGTLPHKHRGIPLDVRGVTLDAHAFAEHLHRKDAEGHMTLNQRFGSALSSGLDSGTGTLVSQDHKKALGAVISTLESGAHVDVLSGAQ